MIVLGIESSCDETAVAIVEDNRHIHSHCIHSQISKHQLYGGVVPEIAARQHMIHMPDIISKALQQSNLHINQIDGIAVTSGPGLIGGLIVGVMMAKSIASVIQKPCIEVNHLEGHALTPRLLYEDLHFPYLLLLISGGHCQILIAEGVGKYHLLGETRDDSPGEAFDKVAKMLNLDYPGGPIIEKLAKNGNPHAIAFPKPLYKQQHCDFSFSGLKTAVRLYLESIKLENLNQTLKSQYINDICSSFQKTITEILIDRLIQAIPIATKDFGIKKVVISGGVASNQYIRRRITYTLATHNLDTIFPSAELCTDNGAMIAWVGIEKLKLDKTNSMYFTPKSSWPLNKM